MKKTFLILTALFAFLATARAQIVITEIMYNPPEAGTDSLEYIELFNKTNAPVDVSGWNFTQGFEFVFPAGSTMNAGQYLVIAKSASAMQAVFGITPLVWVTGGALTNSPGEDIALHDDDGNLIDSVDYKNAAPWPLGANGQGNSLVLCDPNADNSLPTSWSDATTSTGITLNGKLIYANPGAASNCATALDAKTDAATVPQNGSTTLNVLSNDALPNPVVSLTIVTGPASGTASVNPDNTIAYTPDAGFCGADNFIYQVCDNGGCDTAHVLIQVQCYTQHSIVEVTTENADGVADSLGIGAELRGIVLGVNVRASAVGVQFTLVNEDNSAGINVFSPTDDFGYIVQEGDEVTIPGTIGQFNGLTQIEPAGITLESQANALAPAVTLIAPSEATESRLIRIENVHLVDAAEWTTGVGPGFNVRVVSDDHPLDTILVRIDNDTEPFNAPAPFASVFNVTGIGGQFDNSQPFTSGYQIQPRYNADIEQIIGTKTVDFSANVSLTPNPAGEFLFLKTDLRFDRVSIFSPEGRVARVLENPNMIEQITVQDLPAGPWFVRFEKDGASWTTRFVKM